MSKTEITNPTDLMDLGVTKEEVYANLKKISMTQILDYLKYFRTVNKVNDAFKKGLMKDSIELRTLFDIDYVIFLKLFLDLQKSQSDEETTIVINRLKSATRYLQDKLDNSIKIKDGFVIKKEYVKDYLKPFFGQSFIEEYASNFNDKGTVKERVMIKLK